MRHFVLWFQLRLHRSSRCRRMFAFGAEAPLLRCPCRAATYSKSPQAPKPGFPRMLTPNSLASSAVSQRLGFGIVRDACESQVPENLMRLVFNTVAWTKKIPGPESGAWLLVAMPGPRLPDYLFGCGLQACVTWRRAAVQIGSAFPRLGSISLLAPCLCSSWVFG